MTCINERALNRNCCCCCHNQKVVCCYISDPDTRNVNSWQYNTQCHSSFRPSGFPTQRCGSHKQKPSSIFEESLLPRAPPQRHPHPAGGLQNQGPSSASQTGQHSRSSQEMESNTNTVQHRPHGHNHASSPDKLCYYHHTFGEAARQCR